MKIVPFHTTLLATLIALGSSALIIDASAQAPDKTQSQQQIRDRDIYGWEMMTAKERNEYREKMRAAKTVEEREKIRSEHHALMATRAKERGVKLPDEPPARGPDTRMGPGGGMGPGGNPGPRR